MPEAHFSKNPVMSVIIEPMVMDHYDQVLALWQRSEGIGLSNADSRANIRRYLVRNPGLSLIARVDDMIIGAMLCGHDGRRGYIHHLAVADDYRQREIGRRLVVQGLQRLKMEGIVKCHLFVFKDNIAAIHFWRKLGFTERVDLSMMSKMNE